MKRFLSKFLKSELAGGAKAVFIIAASLLLASAIFSLLRPEAGSIASSIGQVAVLVLCLFYCYRLAKDGCDRLEKWADEESK